MKKRKNVLRVSCISSLILGLCAVYLFGSTELYRVDAGYYHDNKVEGIPGPDPNISEDEIIIVDHSASGWQTYSINREDDEHSNGSKVISLLDSSIDAGRELEIGQVLEIKYEFIVRVEPPYFEHISSLKFVRDATDDEFQAATEYYNKYCQWMED